MTVLTRNIFVSLASIYVFLFLSGCRECVNDEGEWDQEKCIEICSEKKSQEKCDGITFTSVAVDHSHGCAWKRFHETESSENGDCVYGETSEKCIYYSGGEGGEPSGLYCEDDSDETGVSEEMDEEVHVAYYEQGDRVFVTTEYTSNAFHSNVDIFSCEWQWHNSPGGEYYTLESPLECTCPCEDEFPGWL